MFSPYSITEPFSCTSSLFELRFPRTSLLFQDINSHRTMFQCYDYLEVLTVTRPCMKVTGPCLKVTGQTFKGLPFTGHVFMYSADFPRRVFGGCTVHEHWSVFLYYKTIGTVVPTHWLVFQELTNHRNKLSGIWLFEDFDSHWTVIQGLHIYRTNFQGLTQTTSICMRSSSRVHILVNCEPIDSKLSLLLLVGFALEHFH